MSLKITDLSVGDWVTYNEEYYQILNVGAMVYVVGKGLQLCHYCTLTRGMDIQDDIDINEISPIPITTEFLEKNGCEQLEDWNNPTRLSYAAEDYYATGWMGKESWSCGVHNDNIDELVIIAKAKYVHELQHALRLAGNTREIEI